MTGHKPALNSSDNLPSYPPDDHYRPEIMSTGGDGFRSLQRLPTNWAITHAEIND